MNHSRYLNVVAEDAIENHVAPGGKTAITGKQILPAPTNESALSSQRKVFIEHRENLVCGTFVFIRYIAPNQHQISARLLADLESQAALLGSAQSPGFAFNFLKEFGQRFLGVCRESPRREIGLAFFQ